MNAGALHLPALGGRLGMGIGVDLPWSGRIGFRRAAEGDGITEPLRNFLVANRTAFHYLFFAFQPKDRNRLRPDAYFAAYDELFSFVPDFRTRGFHQTMLNMGSMEPYERKDLITFTNSLIARYGFSWVVEDLGLWSIAGKTVPYPLPPFMTREGLRACIRNVREVSAGLDAPLSVEFPGFTEGTNFYIGDYDAFDYFREMADQADVAVTIDIGHIISYQWLRGNQGERMFIGLERLPLDRCFEFHLSGCAITKGKFRDLHHGVLLDEQIDLLEYLLPLCPNLQAVSYEDPQYTDDGVLIANSLRNFERMKNLVDAWTSSHVL